MSAHNDDIDAEFQSLVASLGSTPAAGDSLPSLDPDDTPVDESLHLEGGRLSVALVLAPISYPEALHSLLALTGVRESIVRLKPWTAVWLRVETTPTDEEELDALLTGQRPMPDAVDRVARAVSNLSKYGAVALMSWLVEGDGVEPGVSGRISAQRYVSGEPEETIPAGLLLGAMPAATEDLLLGRTTPADYKDSVAADGSCQGGGPFGWLRRKLSMTSTPSVRPSILSVSALPCAWMCAEIAWPRAVGAVRVATCGRLCAPSTMREWPAWSSPT